MHAGSACEGHCSSKLHAAGYVNACIAMNEYNCVMVAEWNE